MAQLTPKMGLTEWTAPLDPYDYKQLANDWNIVDFHDHSPGKGVRIPYGGLDVNSVGTTNILSGSINSGLLSSDVAQSAGVNQSGQVVKGYTATTSDSTGSSSFVYMSTPDQVSNLVLPVGGLIQVLYQATWRESVAASARAAIFIGANQLSVVINSGNGSTGPQTQAAYTGSGSATNVNYSLSSSLMGLVGGSDGVSTNYPGDVTTGQVVGTGASNSFGSVSIGGGGFQPNMEANYGACYVFAAAGTYTVGVKFRVVSGGTVTRINGQLWVRVLDFT